MRMNPARKVGILGGTFNPIHNGHLFLATQAFHHLKLDELLLMPTNVSWQKTGGSTQFTSPTASQRYRMVHLAATGTPFTASPLEVHRPGDTYTVDTLRELAHLTPNAHLYLVLGTDAYNNLPTWKHADAIPSLATLVVGEREGTIDGALSSKFPYQTLPMPLLGGFALSSTTIRVLLNQGLPIDYLVPPAVNTYIRTHRLYEPHVGGD